MSGEMLKKWGKPQILMFPEEYLLAQNYINHPPPYKSTNERNGGIVLWVRFAVMGSAE